MEASRISQSKEADLLDPSCHTAGPRSANGVISAGLLAQAVVRESVAAISEMRRTPLQGCCEPFAVSALKHFDEQTLAVLKAVLLVIDELRVDRAGSSFRDWGVLAAPRFLARALMIPSMARFHAEGAWGVSPHLVPYRSLHSISGTVSQFLKIHGPNFGVGGGPGAAGELLLSGCTLLLSMHLPGLWLVASRIEPDQGLGDNGRPSDEASCEAIALALVPEGIAAPYRLEFTPGGPVEFSALAGLLDTLTTRSVATLTLGDGGRLVIRRSIPVTGPHFYRTRSSRSRR
jgi:hypothetical protein